MEMPSVCELWKILQFRTSIWWMGYSCCWAL